jgi:NAD-dependent SIR2 family protein deacetylase
VGERVTAQTVRTKPRSHDEAQASEDVATSATTRRYVTKCTLGSQMRPNIVWFGESVQNRGVAATEVSTADVVLVIGTSLHFYPSAGLSELARSDALSILVDPAPCRVPEGFRTVTASAETEVPALGSSRFRVGKCIKSG